MNLKYILLKKTSWLILTSLFIFDSVWSYIAISKYHLHELNLMIAYVVEKYPILYFLCIPLQLIIIYLIVKFIKKISLIVLKKQKINKKFLEQVILTALVIFWSMSNSSVNLLSIFFHHLPAISWPILSFFGIITSIVYSYIVLRKNGIK